MGAKSKSLAALLVICLTPLLSGCVTEILAHKLIDRAPYDRSTPSCAQYYDKEITFPVGPPDAMLHAAILEPRPRPYFSFTLPIQPGQDYHKLAQQELVARVSATKGVPKGEYQICCVKISHTTTTTRYSHTKTTTHPADKSNQTEATTRQTVRETLTVQSFATPVPGKCESGNTRWKGTIILLDGWMGGYRHCQGLLPLAMKLSDSGYRTVTVDLRAQGDSTGNFQTWGNLEAKDIQQVISQLQAQGLAGERVMIIGHSYGAGVAIGAASDKRIVSVIASGPGNSQRVHFEVTRKYSKIYYPVLYFLWSPFVDNAVWQKAITRAGQLGNFDPEHEDPVVRVKETSAPLLILQGTADDVCPVTYARNILAARPQGTTLKLYEGEGHGSCLWRPDCWDLVLEWLEKHPLSTKATTAPATTTTAPTTKTK